MGVLVTERTLHLHLQAHTCRGCLPRVSIRAPQTPNANTGQRAQPSVRAAAGRPEWTTSWGRDLEGKDGTDTRRTYRRSRRAWGPLRPQQTTRPLREERARKVQTRPGIPAPCPVRSLPQRILFPEPLLLRQVSRPAANSTPPPPLLQLLTAPQLSARALGTRGRAG